MNWRGGEKNIESSDGTTALKSHKLKVDTRKGLLIRINPISFLTPPFSPHLNPHLHLQLNSNCYSFSFDFPSSFAQFLLNPLPLSRLSHPRPQFLPPLRRIYGWHSLSLAELPDLASTVIRMGREHKLNHIGFIIQVFYKSEIV